MNSGWSQIYVGSLNNRWRPEMQSFYYKSLCFEGLGSGFPHEAAMMGLRAIGTGPGAKIVRYFLSLFDFRVSLESPRM